MQTNLYNSEAEQIQAQTKGRTRNCFPAATNSSLLVNGLACYKAASCIINERDLIIQKVWRSWITNQRPAPYIPALVSIQFFCFLELNFSVLYSQWPTLYWSHFEKVFPPFLSLKYHDLDSIQVLKTQKGCKILLGRFHCSLFFPLESVLFQEPFAIVCSFDRPKPNYITS